MYSCGLTLIRLLKVPERNARSGMKMHSHTREIHGISWLQIVTVLKDDYLIIITVIIRRLNGKIIFLDLFFVPGNFLIKGISAFK